MSINSEKSNEEEENDFMYDGRGTVIRKNVDRREYDFANNFMNIF